MIITRGFVLMSFLLIFASGALAQDSLLGKKKGGGSSGGGSSSPPPRQSSGSSHHDRNSGSSNNGSDDSSSEQRPSSGYSKNAYVAPDLGRRKYQSRSGRVNYGTTNNFLGKQNDHRSPIHIQRAPTRGDLDDATASMREQIRREDRSHAHDRDRDRDHDHDRDDFNFGGGFRIGYYQYDTRFRDDYFCYPYYVFNPYQVDDCVVSPWYYYSYLPAYVDTNRIVINSAYGPAFVGFPYNYEPDARYRDDYYDDDRNARYDNNYITHRALDNALDDLIDAFNHQNRRAIDRLVPARGNVSLAVDGNIGYGVRADDFYDMMMDVVMNSQTIDYQIVSVQTADDEAEVIAKHDYLDSWGLRQCVYHKYHLYGERGNVVIRYFETASSFYW